MTSIRSLCMIVRDVIRHTAMDMLTGQDIRRLW